MREALDKLKKIELRYLYLIVMAIIALIVALDFLTLMKLQMGINEALDRKNTQLTKDIEDLGANKQRLAQFQSQLDLVRRARANFNAMVHTKDSVPVVLKNVSSIANEYGVKIDQLLPQSVETKPLVKNEDGSYYSMSIAVRVRSGYHSFAKFLARLEAERIFWKLDELVINADTTDPQRHDIRMTMKVLILEK